MNRSGPLRVIVADDHTIVREGIAALFAVQPDIEVAGECGDGATALEMIHSIKPDFAVLDLNMPGLTGLEVVRRVRQSRCLTRLLILSISRDQTVVAEALRAGADGYLLKDGPWRHLLDAIRFVQDGGVYVTPLLRGAGLFTAAAVTRGDDPLAMLSQREAEVFAHLVRGVRPKEIARLLCISPKTVDTYRANLMRKLNLRDLVELVKFAIERNLISIS